MGRVILLLILLLSLAGATYILLDKQSDDPLAVTFCFGIPLVFIVIAVVMGTLLDGATLFRRKTAPAVIGRCRHCGSDYHAGEAHCLGCGRPTGYAVQSDRMRSRRADERQDRPPEADGPPDPTPHAASTAAQILVEQAHVHEVEQLNTIEACLTDPATAKRMYHLAAHRLHPDKNGGAHLPEWYRVQAAIDVLNRHHQM